MDGDRMCVVLFPLGFRDTGVNAEEKKTSFFKTPSYRDAHVTSCQLNRPQLFSVVLYSLCEFRATVQVGTAGKCMLSGSTDSHD